MNGRIYDPLLGRFMSADKKIQDPHDLQDFNRYSYVLNNPLRYVDPSGYAWYTDGWNWFWDGFAVLWNNATGGLMSTNGATINTNTNADSGGLGGSGGGSSGVSGICGVTQVCVTAPRDVPLTNDAGNKGPGSN